MRLIALLILFLAGCVGAPPAVDNENQGLADCSAEPPSVTCGAETTLSCRHAQTGAPVDGCSSSDGLTWCCHFDPQPAPLACAVTTAEEPDARCGSGQTTVAVCNNVINNPDPVLCTNTLGREEYSNGKVWCCASEPSLGESKNGN